MLALLLATPFLPWEDSLDMTLLGTWSHPDSSYEAYCVAAKAGWVFLGMNRGLYVLDARDPKDIRVVEVRDSLMRAGEMLIKDSLLFVTHGGSRYLSIYYLSADSTGYTLRRLSDINLIEGSKLPTYASASSQNLVIINDTIIAVALPGFISSISFVNFKNPRNPKLITRFISPKPLTFYYITYHPSGYLYFPITFLRDSTDSIPTCAIKVLDVSNLPEVEEVDSVEVPGLIWGPLAVNGDYMVEVTAARGWGAEAFSLREDPAHPEFLGWLPLNWGDDFLWRSNWLLYATTDNDGLYVCVYEVKERAPDTLHYAIKGYYRIDLIISDITWADGNFYIVPQDWDSMDLYIFHYLGDTTSDTLERDTSSLSKRFSLSTFPRNGKLVLNLPFRGNWELSLYSAPGALVLKKELFGKEGKVEVELPPLGAGVYFARVVEEGEGLEARGKTVISR